MTAVFIAKLAPPKVAASFNRAVGLLAGIPSVVYGLVGMLVLVPFVCKVISDDDEVDERFLRVKRELISDIAKKPDDGEFALDILMIAKYLERIGDHAVNIAQWVIFSFPEQAAR